MIQQRLVLLSSPDPTASIADVLSVCHGFPSRNAQSNISGKVVCLGGQFVVLLEGDRKGLPKLVERLQHEVPEAGLTVRSRRLSEERAFTGWSIGDVYLDEIAQRDSTAAGELANHVIDLLAGVEHEEVDTFAESARLAERFASIAVREAAPPMAEAMPEEVSQTEEEVTQAEETQAAA